MRLRKFNFFCHIFSPLFLKKPPPSFQKKAGTAFRLVRLQRLAAENAPYKAAGPGTGDVRFPRPGPRIVLAFFHTSARRLLPVLLGFRLLIHLVHAHAGQRAQAALHNGREHRHHHALPAV